MDNDDNDDDDNDDHDDDAPPRIGLQRVLGGGQGNNSTSRMVGLKPGFILGRSSKVPDPRRPDLGLTQANAEQVSRHECTVEAVTSTSITLFIPDRLFHNPRVYQPLIVRRHHATLPPGPAVVPVPNQRFTLSVGDRLVFPTGRKYEDHSFQVTALSHCNSTTNDPPDSTTRPSTSTTGTTSTGSTSSSTGRGRKRPATNSMLLATNKVSKPPPPAMPRRWRPKRNYRLLPPGTTPFICPFEVTNVSNVLVQPMQPPALDATQLEDQLLQEYQSWWRVRAQVPSVEKVEESPNADSDEDEHEEEDDPVGGSCTTTKTTTTTTAKTRGCNRRDIHTTVGNTLFKAISESTTPTMGATLLSVTMSHGRLPSRQLVRSLTQSILMNLDAESSPSVFHRRLMMEYLEQIGAQHPTILPDRLAAAIGPDDWRDVLKQISTLPPPARATITKDSGGDDHNHEILHESLEKHLLALKLVYLMLGGSQVRHYHCCASPRYAGTFHPVPLVRIPNIGEYWGAEACRLPASTFSQFVVGFGEHLGLSSLSSSSSSSETDDEHSTVLTTVVSEMTEYLGWVVRFIVHKILLMSPQSSHRQRVLSALAIELQSSLKSRLDHDDDDAHHHTTTTTSTRSTRSSSKSKTAQQHKKMTIYWLQSLHLGDVSVPLEKTLAKTLRISEEYYNPTTNL